MQEYAAGSNNLILLGRYRRTLSAFSCAFAYNNNIMNIITQLAKKKDGENYV